MTVHELKPYFNETRQKLMCSGKEKKRILGDLKNEVSVFLSEHPAADKKDVIGVFGTPDEIAASVGMSEADRIKTVFFKRAVLTALLIALLLYAAFIVSGFLDVHTEAHGYTESGILVSARLWEGMLP